VTVLTMILAAVLALNLTNAKQIFEIVLMFGAGSGLVFLLRWYWWRVNAPAEIAAMLGSGAMALLLNFSPLGELVPSPWGLPIAVFCTTLIWMVTMFLTRPTGDERLQSFVRAIGPSGPGWDAVRQQIPPEEIPPIAARDQLSHGVLSAFLGCIMVYAMLFGIGWTLYGQITQAFVSFGVVALAAASFAVRRK